MFWQWKNFKENIAYHQQDCKPGIMVGIERILLLFALKTELIILER